MSDKTNQPPHSGASNSSHTGHSVSHPPITHAPPSPDALALITDLFQRILGPLAATGISKLLHEPDNIEERVFLLVEVFHEHHQLIHPFRTLVKSMNAKETEVALEEQIRFFTTKHTRNWLIVNLMNQVLDIKELKLDEATGRLPAKPQDLINYANKAQSALGEEGRYKDLTFAAGLLFDFLYYLQRTTYLDLGQSKFDEPINQAFTKAVEQAKVIVHLNRHKSKLTLEKQAPLTAFMRQLAQVCFTLLRPTQAPEFYKKLMATKHTEAFRLAEEMHTFEVHTGMIAAYLSQSLKIFEHLGEGMSVWAFPYLSWVSGKRDIHDLAGMGTLGVAIAERLKGADFPGAGDPSHALPELEYLDFKVNAEVKLEVKI